MKNAYSTFMAFFIPFSAAILLAYFGMYLFPEWSPDHNKGGLQFGEGYHETPIDQQIYGLLIFSLFILSFALPFFVNDRSEPIERTEIKLNE